MMNYKRGGTQKDIYTKSEVENVNCPFCNHNMYRDIYIERGVLGVVRCLVCNLIYVTPRLKNPEKIYWGDEKIYFDEARLIFEGKAKHHRDANYLQDLKIIERYMPSGNLLDIGTNMGFFLRLARNRYWQLYGVEPSPALSQIARVYFYLNVKTAFLKDVDFKESFFDVVTMTDVFEHLPNPKEILHQIHKLLSPEGILYIKVPNGLFNLFKLNYLMLTGRLKDHDIFDSYEHIIHYTHKTLKDMLKKHGFKVIKTCIGKPMQTPTWHNYVGHYYQYPVPWVLDYKRQSARNILYFLSLIEYKLRRSIGYLAPNIIMIARSVDKRM